MKHPRAVFALIAVCLAGCAKQHEPLPPMLTTVTRTVSPTIPRECRAKNPSTPIIEGGTAGQVEDHIADQDETIETLKTLRNVCAASLNKQVATSKD